MPKQQNRQTHGHMRAVQSSVIRQYLPERYWQFFFSSELHNIDRAGIKFYHVECSPATYYMYQGKIHYKRKIGYAKPSIVDFPRGKVSKLCPLVVFGKLFLGYSIFFWASAFGYFLLSGQIFRKFRRQEKTPFMGVSFPEREKHDRLATAGTFSRQE